MLKLLKYSIIFFYIQLSAQGHLVAVIESINNKQFLKPLFWKEYQKWSNADTLENKNKILNQKNGLFIRNNNDLIGNISIEKIQFNGNKIELDCDLYKIANISNQFERWTGIPKFKPLLVTNDTINFHSINRINKLSPEYIMEYKPLILQILSNNSILKNTKYKDIDILNLFEIKKNGELIKIRLIFDANHIDGPRSTRYSDIIIHKSNKKEIKVLTPILLNQFAEYFDLVDIGDYDKDNTIDALFWFNSYNKDGYVMFYNNFKENIKHLWSYH